MHGSRSRVLRRMVLGATLLPALIIAFGSGMAGAVERMAVLEYFTSTT